MSRGHYRVYQMFYYVRSMATLAFSNLNILRLALVKSISPPISAHGLLAIPILTVLLCFATVAWTFAFFLLPALLTCAWAILQPWRLYKFLRSRMTGPNFSS